MAPPVGHARIRLGRGGKAEVRRQEIEWKIKEKKKEIVIVHWCLHIILEEQ